MRSTIRQYAIPRLKKNPLLYDLNAWLKAGHIRFSSSRLKDRYERLARARGIVYSEAEALAQLRAALSRRRHQPAPKARGALRILWVGANWFQDSSGFLAGLQRLAQVHVFTNADGVYGLRQKGSGDVAANDASLAEHIASLTRTEPLDIIMGQMWAHFISAESLQRAQQTGIVTINVSMDDRLPELWQRRRGLRIGSVGLSSALDMVLTSSPDCCERYMVEGCPALFFPMASDPDRFKPYPESEKEHDVSFVGSKYGLRGRVVAALERSGVRVAAFGPGWPNGSIDADRSAEVFGKSRIVLGVGTIGHSESMFTLKLRDFDATMAGALYITHRNPDLLTLFEEGKELACYLSIEECVHKVNYYLAHPEHRQAIAAAGRSRALRDHTWEQRIGRVLMAMGLLSPSALAERCL